MRLHLVRHGRTASNVAGLLDTAHPGAPLDEVGLAQASALVGRLGGVALDALYTSDIVRAVQTGTPLAIDRGLPLTPLVGLREIPAGDLELAAEWQGYIDVLRAWGQGRPDARCPGGEDLFMFLGRFDEAIASIVDAGHATALLVSHGAAMRTWLAARLDGATPFEVARWELGNTAVIALDGDTAGWRVASWDSGVTHDTFQDRPEG